MTFTPNMIIMIGAGVDGKSLMCLAINTIGDLSKESIVISASKVIKDKDRSGHSIEEIDLLCWQYLFSLL